MLIRSSWFGRIFLQKDQERGKCAVSQSSSKTPNPIISNPKSTTVSQSLNPIISNPKSTKSTDGVDAYALGLTNKSSFRPFDQLRRTTKKEPRFCSHYLSPSRLHRLKNGTVITSVCEEGVISVEGEVLVLDAGLEAELRKYCPCLNKAYTFEQFLIYQKKKHGAHKKFEADFFSTVLRLGKPFIDKLEEFLNFNGFKDGQHISCHTFVKSLETYLKVKIKVDFKEHKTIENCFYLMGIVILFNRELIAMDYNAFPDARINETRVFMFEDITKRLQSKKAKATTTDCSQQ